MNTQPQLLPKFKKLNSLQRRLENWLINYQGEQRPIDAQLCFEQLGLEYTRKNYKKFYMALWEINNCPDARVSYRLKDFYFAEFDDEKALRKLVDIGTRLTENEEDTIAGFTLNEKGQLVKVVRVNEDTWEYKESAVRTTQEPIEETRISQSPFDVLQTCYKQLAQLSKEDAHKILQSLTIML